jgi:hypothetical protein
MAEAIAQVRTRSQTPTGARLRLRAIGKAYLDFARTQPGLFDTAFTATMHRSRGAADADPRPLDYVKQALDNLVQTGLLDPAQRPNIEYPTWAAVHGLAVLLRGPLRALPDREKTRLEAVTLAFIESSVSSKRHQHPADP